MGANSSKWHKRSHAWDESCDTQSSPTLEVYTEEPSTSDTYVESHEQSSVPDTCVPETEIQALQRRCEVAENRAESAELKFKVAEKKALELEQQQCEALGRHVGNWIDSNNDWEVRRSEIEFTDRVLGRGAWAEVRVARFRGLEVAAKCMHQVIISSYNQGIFIREMSILAQLRHPNLLQFIGATTEGDSVILTELMETSLRNIISRSNMPLYPRHIASIGTQVAQAVTYLHLRKPEPIIHRDITSANVLLNHGANSSWIAKVGDFGSANIQKSIQTAAPGNCAYSAPESLDPTQQSVKMDVFSFGILLIEMCTLTFPNPHERYMQLTQLQLSGSHFFQVSFDCLKDDPFKRPSMGDVAERMSRISVVTENEGRLSALSIHDVEEGAFPVSEIRESSAEESTPPDTYELESMLTPDNADLSEYMTQQVEVLPPETSAPFQSKSKDEDMAMKSEEVPDDGLQPMEPEAAVEHDITRLFELQVQPIEYIHETHAESLPQPLFLPSELEDDSSLPVNLVVELVSSEARSDKNQEEDREENSVIAQAEKDGISRAETEDATTHGQHCVNSAKDEMHIITRETESAKTHFHWGKRAPPSTYRQSESLLLPQVPSNLNNDSSLAINPVTEGTSSESGHDQKRVQDKHGQHSTHSMEDEVHVAERKTKSAKTHCYWGKRAPPSMYMYEQSESLPLPKEPQCEPDIGGSSPVSMEEQTSSVPNRDLEQEEDTPAQDETSSQDGMLQVVVAASMKDSAPVPPSELDNDSSLLTSTEEHTTTESRSDHKQEEGDVEVETSSQNELQDIPISTPVEQATLHGQHSSHSMEDEMHVATRKTKSAKTHCNWGKRAPPSMYKQSESLPLPKVPTSEPDIDGSSPVIVEKHASSELEQVHEKEEDVSQAETLSQVGLQQVGASAMMEGASPHNQHNACSVEEEMYVFAKKSKPAKAHQNWGKQAPPSVYMRSELLPPPKETCTPPERDQDSSLPINLEEHTSFESKDDRKQAKDRGEDSDFQTERSSQDGLKPAASPPLIEDATPVPLSGLDHGSSLAVKETIEHTSSDDQQQVQEKEEHATAQPEGSLKNGLQQITTALIALLDNKPVQSILGPLVPSHVAEENKKGAINQQPCEPWNKTLPEKKRKGMCCLPGAAKPELRRRLSNVKSEPRRNRRVFSDPHFQVKTGRKSSLGRHTRMQYKGRDRVASESSLYQCGRQTVLGRSRTYVKKRRRKRGASEPPLNQVRKKSSLGGGRVIFSISDAVEGDEVQGEDQTGNCSTWPQPCPRQSKNATSKSPHSWTLHREQPPLNNTQHSTKVMYTSPICTAPIATTLHPPEYFTRRTPERSPPSPNSFSHDGEESDSSSSSDAEEVDSSGHIMDSTRVMYTSPVCMAPIATTLHPPEYFTRRTPERSPPSPNSFISHDGEESDSSSSSDAEEVDSSMKYVAVLLKPKIISCEPWTAYLSVCLCYSGDHVKAVKELIAEMCDTDYEACSQPLQFDDHLKLEVAEEDAQRQGYKITPLIDNAILKKEDIDRNYPYSEQPGGQSVKVDDVYPHKIPLQIQSIIDHPEPLDCALELHGQKEGEDFTLKFRLCNPRKATQLTSPKRDHNRDILDSVPRMSTLMNEVGARSTKWEAVGYELGLDGGVIGQIQADVQKTQVKFQRVFQEWERTTPKRTWRMVINALIAKQVGEHKLAHDLKSKLLENDR